MFSGSTAKLAMPGSAVPNTTSMAATPRTIVITPLAMRLAKRRMNSS